MEVAAIRTSAADQMDVISILAGNAMDGSKLRQNSRFSLISVHRVL
jgi:hypothetical protein